MVSPHAVVPKEKAAALLLSSCRSESIQLKAIVGVCSELLLIDPGVELGGSILYWGSCGPLHCAKVR